MARAFLACVSFGPSTSPLPFLLRFLLEYVSLSTLTLFLLHTGMHITQAKQTSRFQPFLYSREGKGVIETIFGVDDRLGEPQTFSFNLQVSFPCRGAETLIIGITLHFKTVGANNFRLMKDSTVP